MTVEELKALVIRQRQVYGDALLDVAKVLQSEGHRTLAEYTLLIRDKYGLGEFDTRKLNIVKPAENRKQFDEFELEAEILEILKKHKVKLGLNQMRRLTNGVIRDEIWWKVRRKLITEGKIKTSGNNRSCLYWMA